MLIRGRPQLHATRRGQKARGAIGTQQSQFVFAIVHPALMIHFLTQFLEGPVGILRASLVKHVMHVVVGVDDALLLHVAAETDEYLRVALRLTGVDRLVDGTRQQDIEHGGRFRIGIHAGGSVDFSDEHLADSRDLFRRHASLGDRSGSFRRSHRASKPYVVSAQ